MLHQATGWIVYNLLGMPWESKVAEGVHFFLYDSIKILALLFVMISVIGTLRTFLPRERIKAWLARSKGVGHLLAALFGAVTPFCSCSSIPIFFGFLESGIPLGVTFSFLITSPLVNEYLVVVMLGMFGWKITLAYVISGIGIGVITGLILGRMKLERFLMPDVVPVDEKGSCGRVEYGGNFAKRVRFGLREAASIVKRMWLWILLGVGVGAVIHNYVPQSVVEQTMQRTGIFSVPLAVAIGVPLYGSCVAIVPIALALFDKGFPLGTALAFMMAVAALSLPEAIMLRRAMRVRLILIFFGITSLAIVLTGYVFNFLQRILM